MVFPRTESDLSHKLMSLLVFCVGGGVGGGFVHCFIFLLFSFETILCNETLTSLWSPVWLWIYELMAIPRLVLLSARISGKCHHACLLSYSSVCGRSMCMCVCVWGGTGIYECGDHMATLVFGWKVPPLLLFEIGSLIGFYILQVI